jgi:outer membrane lipoprotein-sorting protein
MSNIHRNRFKAHLLLPVIAVLCIGWAGSWEELKSEAGTVTSVKAAFRQEKHLKILAKPLVSEGVFYYQAPRSLRWEYIRPVPSILLMHNGSVQRYVKTASGLEMERSTGLDAMQVVLDEITRWLQGRFDESEMFAAQLEGAGRIVLTPREAAFKAIIERIEINLAEQVGVIQDVVIFESPDAYTRMLFSDTTLNMTIDESIFREVP